MQNERDVQFTPSPAIGSPGDVTFEASPALEGSAGSGSTGAAGAASSAASGAADKAKDKAQQLADSAQQLAGDLQQRATGQVTSQLEAQKHRAAESLGSVADSIRGTGESLKSLPGGVSGYLYQAADQVEGMARYLEERDVEEIVDTVEDFARRQPMAFVGGAFVLGMLGARFLKSSRRNLVHEGVREHWTTNEMTSRVRDPERDAVGRPQAPGYAPPQERASSEYKAAGPRNT